MSLNHFNNKNFFAYFKQFFANFYKDAAKKRSSAEHKCDQTSQNETSQMFKRPAEGT